MQPPIPPYQPTPNPRRKLFGWALFIALAVMLFLLLNKSGAPYPSVAISDVFEQLKDGHVSYVTIDGDRLLGEFRTPLPVGDQGERVLKFQSALPQGSGSDFSTVRYLTENAQGAKVYVGNNPNLLVNILVPLIPWLLIFGFIWFFVFRQLRSVRKPGTPAEPVRVIIMNLPGNVPMATEIEPPPPPPPAV